jgi:hypothetical protein
MAKSNSMLDLRGTVDGLTFVKSRTYGDHVRAARGTHKKAKVNEAFKKESEQLLKSNVPAKIIKDALDAHRQDFKGGLLWQRLVSMFRTQLRETGSFNFHQLGPFEVHEKHPLERFLQVEPKVAVDRKKRKLRVTLSHRDHPDFKKAKYIDGYRLGVIGIFTDGLRHKAKPEAIYTGIISMEEAVSPLVLELPLPPRAKSCLLCIRLDGFIGHNVDRTPVNKGMRVVWSGEV